MYAQTNSGSRARSVMRCKKVTVVTALDHGCSGTGVNWQNGHWLQLLESVIPELVVLKKDVTSQNKFSHRCSATDRDAQQPAGALAGYQLLHLCQVLLAGEGRHQLLVSCPPPDEPVPPLVSHQGQLTVTLISLCHYPFVAAALARWRASGPDLCRRWLGGAAGAVTSQVPARTEEGLKPTLT